MWMDIAIVETGNGGDFLLKGNDLQGVFGIENWPYLGMFGGNVEQSTEEVTENETVEAESFDWFGNNLFMSADKVIQFNSRLEKIINTTPLTSAGRIIIQNTIVEDLKFMSSSAKVTVVVSIIDTDRLDVIITIDQELATEQVIIVNFKKQSNGDWFVLDFNNDFFL